MSDLRTAAQQALDALECPGKARTADEQDAITALKAALAEQPVPPIQAKTEAEKIAYAAGWRKALEVARGSAKPVLVLLIAVIAFFWR